MNLRPVASGIILVCALGTSLGACSALEPRADASLLTLLSQAQADAEHSKDSQFKTVRTRQAEELTQEITRLCGLRTDGSPYPSCIEDLADLPTPSSTSASPDDQNSDGTPEGSNSEGTPDAQLWKAAREISDTLDSAPKESRALLTREALELTALGASRVQPPAEVPLPSLELLSLIPASDQEILEAVLRREYATTYFLGLATGFLDDATVNTQQDVLRAHQRLTDDLHTALESVSVELSPELAYELGDYPEPKDAQSASRLIDAVAEDAHNHLLHAASQVTNPQIRWWLISYGGITQAGIHQPD